MNDFDTIDLVNPNGYGKWFSLLGANAYDDSGTYVDTGDINGDGYDDVVLSAPGFHDDSGITYVIFGKSLNNLDLGNLDNNNIGFKIFGPNDHGKSGYYLSVGDINGDGYDDVLIGAPYVNFGTGKTYAIFGKADDFSNIYLANLSNATGFSILGANKKSNTGYTVKTGDINGDKFDDIIIAAPYGDFHGCIDKGEVYVLFGKKDGFEDINLAEFNNTLGFQILGEKIGDCVGYSISAGDINGDNMSDIILGAPDGSAEGTCAGEGRVYVLFGKKDGFVNIDLAKLNQTIGFIINGAKIGDYAGSTVYSTNIDEDNYADIVISAPYASPLEREEAGTVYVLFGKGTGHENINLSNLNNTIGYSIFGANIGDWTGYSISAGDINNDNLKDIIMGVPGASPTGTKDAELCYIVFSKPKNTSVDVDLARLVNATGFDVTGVGNGGYSLSTGDINGDNISDIILGAPYTDIVGKEKAGKVFVIYDYKYHPMPTPSQDSKLGWKEILGIVLGGVVVVAITGYFVKKYYHRDHDVPGPIPGRIETSRLLNGAEN